MLTVPTVGVPPATPLTDQVTTLVEVPLTVAANCVLPDAGSVIALGKIKTPLTMNGAVVAIVPRGVVTEISPVVAPCGTNAATDTRLTVTIVAVTPLKETELTP